MSKFKFPEFSPFLLLFLLSPSLSLKEMELMAPYKIRSIVNSQYLTTVEQGIIGLRTGLVITAPDRGKSATEQQWTLAWDPSMDQRHDGYRIESRQEYLNEVTSYYPDGRTSAVANLWEILDHPDDPAKKMFRNKRTLRCLTLLKSTVDVVERTCSERSRYQHWKLERLDLDLRLRRNLQD
jgi:hypothetical protein